MNAEERPEDIVIRKCPKDGKVRRIYIKLHNQQTLAVADGMGNAYSCGNSVFGDVQDFIKADNFIHPREYSFISFLKEFEV